MFGLELVAVVAVDDPRLAARDVLDREVRRVAAVAQGGDVAALELHAVQQRVDGDAGPLRVELRPGRHAVDVHGEVLARQRLELIPGPRAFLADRAGDREVPLVERDVRGRAGREHREPRFEVLAGWEPVTVAGPATAEAAGDVHRPRDA